MYWLKKKKKNGNLNNFHCKDKKKSPKILVAGYNYTVGLGEIINKRIGVI